MKATLVVAAVVVTLLMSAAGAYFCRGQLLAAWHERGYRSSAKSLATATSPEERRRQMENLRAHVDALVASGHYKRQTFDVSRIKVGSAEATALMAEHQAAFPESTYSVAFGGDTLTVVDRADRVEHWEKLIEKYDKPTTSAAKAQQ